MRTGGLLAEVARLGRVTCEDAVDLATVFARVARLQARDALSGARVMRQRRLTRESDRRP